MDTRLLILIAAGVIVVGGVATFVITNDTEYQVTFNCNNGQCDGHEVIVKKYSDGSELSIDSVPIPTRNLFSFVGWSLDDELVISLDPTSNYVVNNHVTLTAVWSSKTWNEYKPTFSEPESPVLMLMYNDGIFDYRMYYIGTMSNCALTMKDPVKNLGNSQIVDYSGDLDFSSVSSCVSYSYKEGNTQVELISDSNGLQLAQGILSSVGGVSTLVGTIPGPVGVIGNVISGLTSIAGGICGIVDSANSKNVEKIWEEYSRTNSETKTEGIAAMRLSGSIHGLDGVELNHWATEAILGTIDYYQIECYANDDRGYRFVSTSLYTVTDPTSIAYITVDDLDKLVNNEESKRIVVSTIAPNDDSPLVDLNEYDDVVTFYNDGKIIGIGHGDGIVVPTMPDIKNMVQKWSVSNPTINKPKYTDLVKTHTSGDNTFVDYDEVNCHKLYSCVLDKEDMYVNDLYTPISSIKELERIVDNLKGHYFLTNDITIDGDWIPIGNAETPFTGEFYGEGFLITLKYSNTPQVIKQQSGVGLFGVISDAKISNVRINADIYVKHNLTVSDYWLGIGSIAGIIKGDSTIEDIISTSKISTFVTYDNYIRTCAGGIAGVCYSGNTVFLHCKSYDLSIDAHGKWAFVGGILGAVCKSGTKAEITHCLSMGVLKSDGSKSTWNADWDRASTGGILGHSEQGGSFIITYCASDIDGYADAYHHSVGGIFGHGDNGVISYCFHHSSLKTCGEGSCSVNAIENETTTSILSIYYGLYQDRHGC